MPERPFAIAMSFSRKILSPCTVLRGCPTQANLFSFVYETWPGSYLSFDQGLAEYQKHSYCNPGNFNKLINLVNWWFGISKAINFHNLERFTEHFNPGILISKLLIFINSKNLRTIRKLIANEYFQNYSNWASSRRLENGIVPRIQVLMRMAHMQAGHGHCEFNIGSNGKQSLECQNFLWPDNCSENTYNLPVWLLPKDSHASYSVICLLRQCRPMCKSRCCPRQECGWMNWTRLDSPRCRGSLSHASRWRRAGAAWQWKEKNLKLNTSCQPSTNYTSAYTQWTQFQRCVTGLFPTVGPCKKAVFACLASDVKQDTFTFIFLPGDQIMWIVEWNAQLSWQDLPWSCRAPAIFIWIIWLGLHLWIANLN